MMEHARRVYKTDDFEVGDTVIFNGCGKIRPTDNLIVRSMKQVIMSDGSDYIRLDTVYDDGHSAIEGASRFFTKA